MLSDELVAFLESGGGVLVGAVSADGQPCSSRGWGLHVTDPATGSIRLIIDADDPELLADLGDGGAIAVTVSDIRTLRSVQVKGRVAAIEPMTATDRALARQHVDTFFGAVTELDGNPRELLDRLAPNDMVACDLTAAEVFDQTPGPGAGAPLTTAP